MVFSYPIQTALLVAPTSLLGWFSQTHGWFSQPLADVKNTPTKTVEGSDAKIPKTFEEYSKEEAAAAECNDKALNALFGAVDSSQYKLIANCIEAQKAWKILETTHEGDKRVNTAKYQILMTKFENIRMEDKESITKFHGRVRDLANEAERLGRPFEEDNLDLKVLRALPESYSADAKAIRQAHDLKRMTLDQLMGNLETIELAMSEEQKKKKTEKQIAFQVGDLDLEVDVISDDDFQEQLSLVTKQFTKRWLQKKGKQAFMQDPQRSSQTKMMKEKEFKTQPLEARRKGPQCFEFGGFGHIQTECANNMKKKRQAFASTWSDEEPDTEDTDGESNCAFVTLEEQEDSEEQLRILQEKWSDLLDINKRNVSENLLLKSHKQQLPSWFKKYCQVRKKLQEARTEKERMENQGSSAHITHMQGQEDDVAHVLAPDLPQVLCIEYHKSVEEEETVEVPKTDPAPTINVPTHSPPDAPVQEDEEFIQILDEDPLVAVLEVPFQKESVAKKSKKKVIPTEKYKVNSIGLPYPTLLYSLLVSQGFSKEEKDEEELEEPQLQVDSRHMEGKHHNDMEVAGPTTAKDRKAPSLVRFLEQKLMQVKEELTRTSQLKEKLEIEKCQLVVLLRQAREATPDVENTDSEEEVTGSTHSDEEEYHTEGESEEGDLA
ncbi:unnamed protein product [Cuscuta campestris]|uniref:CCHC-type domain-containing protein n=1 Tax=Cuscuta campestris TaxID=132261 RepID=A0A484K158_9ASTE|nr:unnamed protein product [Cuscuta campestris]